MELLKHFNYQPEEFVYLYRNDKAPGKSLEDKIDLENAEGHLLRDSESCKFLFVDNYTKLVPWFVKQEKPYIHSVINKYRPVRFNLELDITPELLANVVFKPEVIKQIENDGLDVDYIKTLKCLEIVKTSISIGLTCFKSVITFL